MTSFFRGFLNSKFLFILSVLLFNFELARSASVKTGLTCKTFYGVNKNVILESIPAWLAVSLDNFLEAQNRQDPQAKFEANILDLHNHPEIDSDKKLVAYLVEVFEEKRKIKPNSHILKPVLVYSKKNDFIALDPSETPPSGYEVAKGTYPEDVYYRFLAEGLFPVGDIASGVNYFNFNVHESSAEHGLCHAGGLYESSTYSRYVQDAAIFRTTFQKGERRTRARESLGFFLESFWFPNKRQIQDVKVFFDSIESFLPGISSDLSLGINAIQGLSREKLFELAGQVIFELPNSTPLGGGARDYSEKATFLKKYKETREEKERLRAKAGYQQLTDLSFRDSLAFLELKAGLVSKDRDLVEANLIQLLKKVYMTSKTEMKDWLEAATKDTSPGAQKVYEIVCRSGIFPATVPIVKVFCN